MEMEDESPPGTKVIVFRLDGHTVVGKGLIEAYLPYAEVPADSENELIANTDRIGEREEVDYEDVEVVRENGERLPLDEVIDERKVPRIRLEDGSVTYGPCCYWRELADYTAPGNN